MIGETMIDKTMIDKTMNNKTMNNKTMTIKTIIQKNAIAVYIFALAGAIILSTSFAMAAPKPKASNVPPFPGTLVNARFVYVTSYDGDQFDPNLFPADRAAINAVQDAIQKWGKFTVVYEPRQADIVLMVMSRPTEDVLAVYDAHGWPQNDYLWRMMARSGLQTGETPLVTDMQKAFDQITNK